MGWLHNKLTFWLKTTYILSLTCICALYLDFSLQFHCITLNENKNIAGFLLETNIVVILCRNKCGKL